MFEGSALGNAEKMGGLRKVKYTDFKWRYVVLGVLLVPVVAVLLIGTAVLIDGPLQ